ncbi:MAG: nickel ABC transporter substrate-binding protein [Enterobacteriaceae bacterium]|jgi:nickel transport system substrate-binding protein|nr:nickel ABC transporter substrate-binding protein [Enterobacteriaceae bacterium]
MFNKALVALALCCCFLTSLSYAADKGSAENDKDTLVIAWPTNVGQLNPHLYNPNQMFAQVMVYDALVRYNGKDVEPALAESWTISPDGKTYTFNLKKDIQFSDGSAFNSSAVAMNFAAIMANAERHGWIALVSMIDNWKTPDENTFVLNLKHPYSITLFELSLPRPFRILAPSGFIDGEVNTSKGIKQPIGTGAWVLSESKLGEYDIFVRNEHYWGKKSSYPQLKVLVLPDANSRVVALETDQVDLLIGEGNFTVENFVRLSKDPQYQANKSEPRSTNMIALNSARNATKDLPVRQAIMHAVNKEALVKYILLNQEEIAHQFYNPTLKYSQIGLVPFTYDVKKANDLLDADGWKKNGVYREKNSLPLELDLHYIGTDPKHKAIAEAIQADLMQVGIKLNLRAEESTIFYSLQANGNFDLIFNKTWGPPFEPGSFTASMRKPSHADYQAQIGLKEKPEIDRTISALIISTDEQDIAKKYKYVLTTLHNEAIYLPFSYELDLALFKKGRINNFQFGEMTTEFMFNEMDLNK